MTKPLLQLQAAINKLTLVQRKHYIADAEQHEDSSSHSLSVAMICWQYYEQFGSGLDEAKIFKYSLVHDLVEIYAGDVNTYADEAALQQKVINEAAALERLTQEFAHFPDLVEHLHGYEAKIDEESRFVWLCDKIQALTHGELDNWRAHIEIGITRQMLSDKLDHFAKQTPLVLREEFARLSRHWIRIYPDILPERP